MRTQALDPRRLADAFSLLEREVDAGRLPGAVLAIGVHAETAFLRSCGYAENLHGRRRTMTTDTMFDLASLTKVVATLPAVLSLVERGRVRLADPVSDFIPAFRGDGKDVVTLRHLLTHTAGLAAHRPPPDNCVTREQVLRGVVEEPLVGRPGAQVLYSDLGFLLLGEIVERLTGASLDRHVRETVFEPLGMSATCFCPNQDLHPRVAATEATAGQPAKVGIVHDENAAALGGVAGHAGLFSPAADLIRYLQFWLDGGLALSSAVRTMATRDHTAEFGAHRGLGWCLRGDGFDHTGDLWPQTAAGHTGFTGTSIAFDPVSGLWTVLLTNRVHYGRERSIVRLRALVHNAVASAVRD